MHKLIGALYEGLSPPASKKPVIRVREHMTTLERSYLEALWSNKRPTIRVKYSPTDTINADFIIPCMSEPKLRRPKPFGNSLLPPKDFKRVPNLSFASASPQSSSLALSPKLSMRHSMTENEIPSCLPRRINYRRRVIKKINKLRGYRSA